MAVKIAVKREYEDEKRHFHSNRLLLVLLLKKLTDLSDAFLTFGGYTSWLQNKIVFLHDTLRLPDYSIELSLQKMHFPSSL